MIDREQFRLDTRNAAAERAVLESQAAVIKKMTVTAECFMQAARDLASAADLVSDRTPVSPVMVANMAAKAARNAAEFNLSAAVADLFDAVNQLQHEVSERSLVWAYTSKEATE